MSEQNLEILDRFDCRYLLMDRKKTVLEPNLRSVFGNCAVFALSFGNEGVFFHLVKIVTPPIAHFAVDQCCVFLVVFELQPFANCQLI